MSEKLSLILYIFIFTAAIFLLQSPVCSAEKVQATQKLEKDIFRIISPPDPIEGYNRVIFEFNDFLMVWLFDPLMKGYSFIIPKSGRRHIDMAIVNLEYFIHLFSSLLEGEFKGAMIETERFFINLTLGVAGIFDVAKSWFNLQPYREDFGQAFATWGIGPGFYFVLPILGPSTLRDAIGEIFFVACHPITWIPVPGLGTFVFVNRMSLRVEQYMSLRDPSLDKYESMKDMWYLNREIEIKNLDRADHPYFTPENGGF
jgi:phospholipid-binding lipoprotein MlaA